MPYPKPSTIFQWCTQPLAPSTALLPPSDALISNGYSLNSKPQYNVFNWVLNLLGAYTAYVSTLDQVLYGPSNPPPAADWGSITGLPSDLAYLDKVQLFTATQIFGPTGTADDKTGAPLQATMISEGGTRLASKYAALAGSNTFKDGPQIFSPGVNIYAGSTTDDGARVPGPVAAPTFIASTFTGTVPADTYDAIFTWVTETGQTTPSPPATATLSAPGELVLEVPTPFPPYATSAAVFIAPAGQVPRLQGLISPGEMGLLTLSSPLIVGAGATPPTSNTAGAMVQAPSFSEGGALLAQKYASITGSPAYAPASGSPSYAPASGSPNYAPATGSTAYAPASGSANYAPAAAAQQASNQYDGALTQGQSGNTLSQNLWAPVSGSYLVNWTMLLSSPNGAMSIATYLMTMPAGTSNYNQVSHKALVAATQGLFNVVVSGSYVVTLAKGDLIYIAGDNTGGETIDILTGSYISAIRIA